MQKTNFKTRLLALLTAVFMVVMCMPFAALADDPDMVVVDLAWDTDQVEVTDPGDFIDDNGNLSFVVKPGGEVAMPTVKGINGYEFKGWTNVGNKTKLTLADVTPYLGVGKSTLQLSAIAEKAPADTIVTVGVLVDTNTMKITNYGDFTRVDDGYATADFDKVGKELTLPTVEGINGYTFTGWDNEVGTATSLTTERAKALCADGKTTAVLNAQAKAPVADTIVTVDVLVDTNTMKITNYGDFTRVDDGYATANFDKVGKELTLPTVEGINGYTFTGWDNEVGTATSLTTERAKELCADGKTTAVLNAQAKAPVADTIVTVDVLVDTNTMKITNYGDFTKVDDGYATANFDKVGKELTLPTVEGINGYTFTGWDNEVGTATSLTTERAKELCADGKTTAVLNAQAKAPVADTIVTVDVLVDTNTMKITNYGDFTKVDDGYATANFDKVGKELTLPTVEGINGYTFTGWDNEVGTATSLTTERAKALCADGKTTAVLNAQAKAPVADTIVTVDVLVDTNTMKITNYGDFTKVDDGYATANFDKVGKELTLPTVEGINGYTFTGWDNKVGTATTLTTERAKELCADGKTTAVLNAQAKAPEATNDKKDNSTSSSSSSSNSSSSSSSNTTTTSASQKQVVKAAAAPANTTKVLPKTGATNAAPLIGGSLAVVALLMGYGVYGLVLRKKD